MASMRARFVSTYYTVEDDGAGGSTTVETRPAEFGDWFDVEDRAEAERIAAEHSLTEDNGHWFSDPDVSRVNFRTGEHTETILALERTGPSGQ